MVQTTFSERRDSVRARRIITVRFRLHKNGRKKTPGAWQISTTENMSLSGLLFVSAVSFNVGDLLEVQVVMSGVLDIFKGYGKVVRVMPHKGGFFHVAIKYVDLKIRRREAKSVFKTTTHRKHHS